MHLVYKLEISCHSNRGVGGVYNYIKLHGSEQRSQADCTDNTDKEETQRQYVRNQCNPL